MQKYIGIAFAALLAVSLTPAVNAQPMSYGAAAGGRTSPEVNNYLSQRYDHLLQVSSRFRNWRMWKECHIINWPGLHASCIGSFDQYEPILPGYR